MISMGIPTFRASEKVFDCGVSRKKFVTIITLLVALDFCNVDVLVEILILIKDTTECDRLRLLLDKRLTITRVLILTTRAPLADEASKCACPRVAPPATKATPTVQCVPHTVGRERGAPTRPLLFSRRRSLAVPSSGRNWKHAWRHSTMHYKSGGGPLQ